ncbi:MAG: Do family serine endopeptidase [Burkholderiales bacterium]|nr:Do family serine endopeptidase [Burkholderiales bacterium]
MNARKPRYKISIAVMAALGLAAAGVSAYQAVRQPDGATTRATSALVSEAGSASGRSVAAWPDFAGMAERVGPAVVNISLESKQTNPDRFTGRQQGSPDIPRDALPDFFRYFRLPDGARGGNGLPLDEAPRRGQGSGFIVAPDGIVLTNAHVVKDADSVRVKLTDRREFQAKVLGADERTDVAVLKIDAKNLPILRMADPAKLRAGEWVLAIGSPYGFENSVSVGVVSAKGRVLPDDRYTPFIQTDVAVNPGNSGGPLLNALGEVVGMNSQIYSRTGGYQGLSFAIPADVVERVKGQIVATGKATHAHLGVRIQDVNQDLADAFKLDHPNGALVASVENGSPAEAAGIKSGDIISGIGGRPVGSSSEVPAIVDQTAPGQSIALTVMRAGQRLELAAKVTDAEKPVAIAAKSASAGGKQLGLALRPRQSSEPGSTLGLIVEEVSGRAAAAGVEPGDILLSVNGTPVSSVSQVRDIVSKAGRSVALLVQRGDDRLFVPVRLS